MQESFSSKHDAKLVGHSLEELLDAGAVSNKSDGHLEATRRNIAMSGLNVVWNPFFTKSFQ